MDGSPALSLAPAPAEFVCSLLDDDEDYMSSDSDTVGIRADIRDLRTKVDHVAEAVAGLVARDEARDRDSGYFHKQMLSFDDRLRIAEKHEENARRINTLESDLGSLRQRLDAAAPMAVVAKALEQLAELQITKARFAGLLAGAAAAGGIGGSLVSVVASALGGP